MANAWRVWGWGVAIWSSGECGGGSTVPNLNVSCDAEVPLTADNVVAGFDAKMLGRIPFVCLSNGVSGLRDVLD